MRTLPLPSPVPVLALGLALVLPAAASALGLLPTAFGKGNDFSDPLDGVAEEVVTSISTQDLNLNAVTDASDPLASEARGILEFDLTGLAPFGVVSAVLELPVSDAVTAVGTIAVYAYAGDGVLGVADFAETGTLVGTPAVAVPVTSLDVTAAVNAILGGGDDIVGFLVAMTVEDQLLSIWNPGASQFDPELVISAVPEPGLAALGVTAAFAAFGARRRR